MESSSSKQIWQNQKRTSRIPKERITRETLSQKCKVMGFKIGEVQNVVDFSGNVSDNFGPGKRASKCVTELITHSLQARHVATWTSLCSGVLA